ncbi:hypothetical protein [Streptomyces sp. LUP30]|uniref:hypothetical protein n=1 Tax=Streptomyces sp. LUP30 TaxID=1890285 RepID=UPI000851EF84|nr:hypothetical protein [Streptomyces sp. LUP30]
MSVCSSPKATRSRSKGTGPTRDSSSRYGQSTSPAAVGARDVSNALGMAMSTARGHLNGAAKDGRIVRLAPGLFCGPSTLPEGNEVTAAMSGNVDLPVHDDAEAKWDGSKASSRVLEWATGDNGDVDPDKLGSAFLWRDPDADPATTGAYMLGFCDVFDGDDGPRLEIVAGLDDGTFARVGAMTMNVGHHRDGAECETAACQFDDSRTVGAIVTVGLNERGLWFSGASAPWLSDWDRAVFAACQPSYHLKEARDGSWQLRAVLTVPVPGHSTPLLAALHAVAERSNLALAASAAGFLPVMDDPSRHDLDARPDAIRTASASSMDTTADLPGQRPDATSGRRDAPAREGPRHTLREPLPGRSYQGPDYPVAAHRADAAAREGARKTPARRAVLPAHSVSCGCSSLHLHPHLPRRDARRRARTRQPRREAQQQHQEPRRECSRLRW